ncbi:MULTISPECIES: RcnB family protein [Xanthomonas]|uniref:RcnB family protein n=1 Tax=Xanthomonas TaxID=338 RepID=UPI0005946662|nr:RcnB family protein [Xanthomonas campestris]MCC5042422.1 RcnB family protein [Xanthomonas campestris]
MNRKRIVTVVLSSILALGFAAPAAFAGDWDRDHDRRGHDRDRDHRRDYDRHDNRNWQAQQRWDDRRRRDDRREWRQDRRVYSNGYREGYQDARYRDRYNDRRVYTYQPVRPAYYGGPRYVRGGYYNGPVYVINDYDRHHLRRPPYGYRWQRDNTGNFLLVAIATGEIADLVLNN